MVSAGVDSGKGSAPPLPAGPAPGSRGL